MIISLNPEPHRSEFDILLNSTLKQLNVEGSTNPKIFANLAGTKLENHVGSMMTELSQGTIFENSIQVIGGQKFPDIVAKKFYGIEVKTTTQNHWKTTGNSVLESTRVSDVERIFMLFAKLANPIEFKCRPYEECLSEVVVTHSPRYLIDMNLPIGKTIFDKMDTTYDTLRKKENPLGHVVDFYKSNLKAGEQLWWIDNNNMSNLSIKMWKNIDREKQKEIITKIMVYFIEIFGSSPKKFERIPAWLVTREGIVTPNIRDLFSSGGKGDLIVGKKIYKNIPRIFLNLFNNLDYALETLVQTSAIELSEYWGIETTENKKISDWIELVSEHSKKITDANHLNIK
ncbi:hypothetical protein, partial [Flavobacterium sp.]|uniref:hypothetical protein n=1 Tax=Flavobacterium sp. TaxID=239 RepID=UPI000EBD901C